MTEILLSIIVPEACVKSFRAFLVLLILLDIFFDLFPFFPNSQCYQILVHDTTHADKTPMLLLGN